MAENLGPSPELAPNILDAIVETYYDTFGSQYHPNSLPAHDMLWEEDPI